MRLAWLLPAALWLGALAALPVAVHLLARQQMRQVRFPTLRFLDAVAAPARRRWHVRDPRLLALRVAVVLAMAAALAGPVLVTPARQASWNEALARAVVTVPGLVEGPAVRQAAAGEAADVRRFVTREVRQGVADAAAWLAAQPQGRREIVVVAPLTRGVLTPADLTTVPAGIGVRLVPAGAWPPADAPRERLVGDGERLWRVQEAVHFEDAATTVREVSRAPAPDGLLTVRADSAQRSDADAARRALLRRGVVLPPSGATPLDLAWTGDVHALALAADAAAPGPDEDAVEPQGLSEAEMRQLSRPMAPRGDAPPRDTGDRRAVWALLLVLLAAETWVRSRAA